MKKIWVRHTQPIWSHLYVGGWKNGVPQTEQKTSHCELPRPIRIWFRRSLNRHQYTEERSQCVSFFKKGRRGKLIQQRANKQCRTHAEIERQNQAQLKSRLLTSPVSNWLKPKWLLLIKVWVTFLPISLTLSSLKKDFYRFCRNLRMKIHFMDTKISEKTWRNSIPPKLRAKSIWPWSEL